jgi:UDP-N-acetylmuramate dehydrogenase
MNAGCYGAETKDVLVRAEGVTRAGQPIAVDRAGFGYTYRHSAAPEGVIWTRAVFQGRPDAPDAIAARIAEITARREASQPIREKTGGSTFKNPEGHSAWKLVDAAGWRGRPFGGAMFSPLHANFLINGGEATAADLEGLGEAVRADVREKLGVGLEWEIKRVGRP